MDQVKPFRRTLCTSGKKIDDGDSLGKADGEGVPWKGCTVFWWHSEHRPGEHELPTPGEQFCLRCSRKTVGSSRGSMCASCPWVPRSCWASQNKTDLTLKVVFNQESSYSYYFTETSVSVECPKLEESDSTDLQSEPRSRHQPGELCFLPHASGVFQGCSKASGSCPSSSTSSHCCRSCSDDVWCCS